MIKKVYTFGTSNTAGGGFEFDSHYRSSDKRGTIRNLNRGDALRRVYKEEPKTQEHYSWPGQLNKLFTENDYKIPVVNISKQGYGNERMYRKFFEITRNNFSKHNSLFIFEFSDLSRKEFWFEPLKNHITMNYSAVQEDKGVQIAHSYYYDDWKIIQKLKEKESLFVEFRKSLINIENELADVSRKITMFLDFLEYNGYNFLISSSPFIWDIDYEDEYKRFSKYFMDFGFDDGIKYPDFHRFADVEKLRIMDETEEEIPDVHPSLFANKIIAKNTFNELVKRNYIDGELLKIPKTPVVTKNKLI